MADFNLKYEFAPHWKNPGETEEIDWNTLEEIFIPDSKLKLFFAVCYEISTSTKEAAHKLNMALIFPNSLHKTTWRQKTFNFYQKEAQDWGGGLFQCFKIWKKICPRIFEIKSYKQKSVLDKYQNIFSYG